MIGEKVVYDQKCFGGREVVRYSNWKGQMSGVAGFVIDLRDTHRNGLPLQKQKAAVLADADAKRNVVDPMEKRVLAKGFWDQ